MLPESITAMIYSSDHFSVDTNAFRLERDGKPCSLEPQVFDVIVYLIEHRDRVVTRDELLDKLWQGRIVSESAINARIKLARKALGDDGKQQRFIRTIHRRGYQFVGEISGAAQAAAQPAVVTAQPAPDKPSIVVLPFENPDAAATGSSLDDGLYKAGVMQPPSSRPEKPSIAVLQFRNLSRDPDQAYFSEGMALNICSRLSRNRSLLVKPGITCDATRVPAVQIARDLEVGYLLSGAVQREGERVRVSAELIDGETGAIKWSEHFDRSGSAIIDIQDDIAGAISGTLWSYRGIIVEAEHERSARKPTQDFNAFDHLLKGIHYKDLYTRESSLQAHRCFKRAIELDPQGAEAYGWIAWEHVVDISMGWSKDNTVALQQAHDAARTAIANDPDSEIGHWALAEALILDGDYAGGFREYDRAMDINPNNPDLKATRGMHEAAQGRFEAGIGMIQQAIVGNRHHPEWYFWSLGIACFAAGQLTEAIDAFEHMQDHNTDSLAYLVASLAHSDRLDEARRRLAEWQRIEPDINLDAMAEAQSCLRDDARHSFLQGLRLVLEGKQPRLKSVT